MSNIILTDDGTLDTVLRCTECGRNYRYMFADSNARTYSDFLADITEETIALHVCGEEDQC